MPEGMANGEQFGLEVSECSSPLRVVEFQGSEALSEPFRFVVTAVSEDAHLDLAPLIGQSATLALHSRTGEPTRYVSGMVAAVAQGQVGRRFAHYQFTLVPNTWILEKRSDCRIFQSMTVEDIIRAVMDSAEVSSDAYRFLLQESHATRSYCVQFGETDLHFVRRLMQEEGMWYFFDHRQGGHTMVITDTPSASAPITGTPALIYHDPQGTPAEREAIYPFGQWNRIETQAVTLKDYDFQRPELALQATANAGGGATLERYQYPGRFLDPGAGAQSARYQLEGERVRVLNAEGKSDCPRLIPGGQFTLEDYHRSELNSEYLVVGIQHYGTQPQAREEDAGAGEADYRNEFECMPASAVFRDPVIMKKPRIEGPQTAIVTGPQGEEIYCDEYGRVKVHFHWDRLGQADERSSCWIRVSQQWAGAGWGAMNVPRIGQEVVVDFLDGDPDRPVITGRVYHGTNVPPYPLPERKAVSTFKTQSTGGDGFNELRFDDAQGQEEVYLHAQRDFNIEVKANKSERVGGDEDVEIGANLNTRVEGDQEDSVGKNDSLTVGKDYNEYVGENAQTRIGGNYTLEVGKDADITVGGESQNHVGSSLQVEAGKDITVVSATEITLKAGNTFIKISDSGDIEINGGEVTVNAAGSIFENGSNIGSN